MTSRQRLRLSLVFAAFEGGGPAVGMLLGGPLGHASAPPPTTLPIAILIGFGLCTLLRREGRKVNRPAASPPLKAPRCCSSASASA